ncbi:pyruvate kinase [Hydrogenimonas urashimensis]|uniref:pyruvate kinase n=1 Tax=Hydrogenimonas urashimensis TaxID=2740515 RepID=UPI001915372D|nr:pyruvate kinase [Hydrogenimonas urashimensis]
MKPKVKIVATVGPSTNNPESIASLIEHGVDVFRLNFSYGTHSEHKETIGMIRSIAREKKRIVGILQDICGPKIRIRGMEEPVEVNKGDHLFLAKEAGKDAFTISFPGIVEDLKENDEIFFADGTVQTRVLQKRDDGVVLEVLTPGRLMEGKGVNFPKADITLHALTDKDREDIRFGASEGVDFVAISFVSSEKDVIEARKIQREAGGTAWIISKIERTAAVENIDTIIDESDGIMVARGDLGAEAGLSRVPVLQKNIIKKCNKKGKPVITATQMLTSMVNSPYPTRAEVSDIANAVFDGTDAVMLSDETAAGHYPYEAVDTLVATILQTQEFYPYYKSFETRPGEAFPHAAASLAQIVSCDFIAALTLSGYTMLHLSKYRPKESLFAITTDPSLINKTALVWGVEGAVTIDHASFHTEQEMVETLLAHHGADPDAFLLVTGYLGEQISMGKSIRYIRREDRNS